MNCEQIINNLEIRIRSLEHTLKQTPEGKAHEWVRGYTQGKIDGYRTSINLLERGE